MVNLVDLGSEGRIGARNPWQQRRFWLAIALGFVFLVLILAPVQGGSDRRGSTYSRAPSGYGAWAEAMEQRGTPLQVWEQALEDWSRNPPAAAQTLVQIYPDRPSPFQSQRLQILLDDWIRQGHTLVILGSRSRATAAPFQTQHSTDFGTVLVDTSRRQPRATVGGSGADPAVLADEFGAIVTVTPQGQGQVIAVVPPYLGANAYQSISGNYEFLAQLVDQGGEIWIDEFLHGYQALDPEEAANDPDQSGNWIQYLWETPLGLVLSQGAIAALLLIVARNRRFGVQLPWRQPQPDNTTAYIHALGAVLHKAESHQFVVETLQKQALHRLCRQLGLGIEAKTGKLTPQEKQSLKTAWGQATGRSTSALDPLLQPPTGSLTEAQLRQWLAAIDSLQIQAEN